MANEKKPWEDVPIEIIIEEEKRKRLEKQKEAERPRIDIQPPIEFPPQQDHQEKEYKIVIDFSL